MNDLEKIGERVRELAQAFDLRPTLEKAADIGDLLSEARALVKHGEWADWLARARLRPRTAWDYLAVANARSANRWPATKMTIKQFLGYMRAADHAERRAEHNRRRKAVSRTNGDLPLGLRLEHADCRTFGWPGQLDAIAADPPWNDVAHYEWLAGFASKNLRDGGLLLVQCGTGFLARVSDILAEAGLSYVWTLAMVFHEARTAALTGSIRPVWRPVLVFARGTAKPPGTLSDVYTVRHGEKTYHDWQQPAEPWRYWLSRLVRPGSTIADPFAGAGTLGVVCHDLGLNYLGTEKDKKAYRVARGRLLKHVQNAPAKDEDASDRAKATTR